MKLIEVSSQNEPTTFDEFVIRKKYYPHPSSMLVVTLEQFLKTLQTERTVHPVAMGNNHISAFGNCPEELNATLCVAGLPITSFEGIPKIIHGMLDISTLPKIKTYHNIHKYVHQIKGNLYCDFKPSLLGLLAIKGVTKITVFNPFDINSGSKISDILNTHLADRDLNACQEDLIDAGYIQQARL